MSIKHKGVKKKRAVGFEWPDDPVVSEVRATRAKLWAEGGGTVEGFLKLIRRRLNELRRQDTGRRA